ncbi:hypothetical protein PsYK624_082050 [Phanerochaete sordida]|uniref:Uncharacterized protein n=1 Tax=Phanerochaete sordida TaxID=48140 RepID=A0A9P3LFI6_9APHY|nr:hypothetical protein PsYK624_082050 [Phanerochaete sordida]
MSIILSFFKLSYGSKHQSGGIGRRHVKNLLRRAVAQTPHGGRLHISPRYDIDLQRCGLMRGNKMDSRLSERAKVKLIVALWRA